MAIIIIVKSVFGLPWFVAATVLSINHIQSLTKESESSAPGEKPHFLGIREQRVTPVLIGLAIGLSTLITPILGLIPKPVLFGVFLFMGVQSLKGLQFFERILLLFIPHKHQPDYVFLKYVPLMRVHMFTLIQLLSLVGLWVTKSNPSTSIAFPVRTLSSFQLKFVVQSGASGHSLGFEDEDLGSSPGWWAATVATYCPNRPGELPKFLFTKPSE